MARRFRTPPPLELARLDDMAFEQREAVSMLVPQQVLLEIAEA